MKHATIWWAILLALVVFPAPGRAQDDDDGDAGGFVEQARKKLPADPVVVDVDDEAAKKMIKAAEDAEDEKDPGALVAALEPFLTARHEDFLKVLDKMAKNRSETVRLVAIKAMGSQAPADKVGPKVLKHLMYKGNEDYPDILAAAIGSLRRLKYDNRRAYDEIESHFRKQLSPPVMLECARYFGDLDKKDAAGMLIAWVEEPRPANPNSGTNPPAAYWKRMWEIWNEIRNAVWVSLGDMSGGKDFHTEQEWRDWFGTREAKEMGFK